MTKMIVFILVAFSSSIFNQFTKTHFNAEVIVIMSAIKLITPKKITKFFSYAVLFVLFIYIAKDGLIQHSFYFVKLVQSFCKHFYMQRVRTTPIFLISCFVYYTLLIYIAKVYGIFYM